MNDRCEALAGVCRSTRGIDPYRCRNGATYTVNDGGRRRRVCTHHIARHVFEDEDQIGDAQRDRMARVLGGE
jgi:hypothetical protein